MKRNHKIWSLISTFEQNHEEEWHRISHEILQQMYPGRGRTDEDLHNLLESMTYEELEMFVKMVSERFNRELAEYTEKHLREKFKKRKKKKKLEQEVDEEEKNEEEQRQEVILSR